MNASVNNEKHGGKQAGKSTGIQAGKRKAEGPMRCPYEKECGGCQNVSRPYKEQLKEKQKYMEKLLAPFGKVQSIIGMKNPDHYRNKVHAVFGIDKKKNIVAGVYKENTHYVVDVDACFLDDEKADAIIGTIKKLLKSFKIKTYNEDTEYGLFRHVLIRTGRQSGEIMVVLVLSSPIMPSKNNFVKALRKEHPEITTVIVNVNDRKTSMVLGDKQQVIYGKGYITDSLCGKSFKLSPKSFYQVNPVQTEILYKTAIDFAGLSGKEVVLGAYCGIGTIGIIAADKAKEVIGVELNKDAVRDAVNNARFNKVKNISFYEKDAGQFMVELAEQRVPIDVVFMDPPRSGSDEAFLSSLVKLSPQKVVYISCGPETLARDLQYLVKKGYRMEKAVPVDMFPHTRAHVETVVLLSK